jgi:hypothetical protein
LCTNSDRHRYGNADAIPYTNTNSDGYPNSYRDANRNRNGDTIYSCDSNTYRDANAYRRGYPNPHSNGHAGVVDSLHQHKGYCPCRRYSLLVSGSPILY